MRSRGSSPWPVLAFAVALLAPVAGSADFRSQNGNTFIDTGKALKPNKVDAMASTIVIPNDFSESMPFGYTCFLQAEIVSADGTERRPIKRVRAAYDTDAYLLDHRDGSVQVLDVTGGRFKTGEFGDFFQIEVPEDVVAAIFTDGFESSNVSAFLITRLVFQKGKRFNSTSLQCLIQEGDL